MLARAQIENMVIIFENFTQSVCMNSHKIAMAVKSQPKIDEFGSGDNQRSAVAQIKYISYALPFAIMCAYQRAMSADNVDNGGARTSPSFFEHSSQN